MDDSVQRLESIARSTRLDFHVYFRQRSLALRELYETASYQQDVATAIPGEICVDASLRTLVETRIEDLRANVLSLLTSPLTARILWCMYCCPFPGFHSGLARLCPSLGAIAPVVRGGPNVYKLSGWLVHVLAAYSTVTDYIPKGELPATYNWHDDAREFFASGLKREYEALDRTGRMVLHTATLGHDIGVARSIPDHETRGVPLVAQYLEELGLTDAVLRQNGFEVALVDLSWAVQSIVQNHTLINRASVEFSTERTAEKMKSLMASAQSSPWRLSFLKHLPGILVLLGVGDLMAVDDALLTPRSIAQIHHGHETLESIIRGEKGTCDYSKEGFQRFLHFLKDYCTPPCQSELDTIIAQAGHRPDRFWCKFYHLQELHFALTLLRCLPDAQAVLSILILLFDFVDSHTGRTDENYRTTRVEFDHSLEAADLMRTAVRMTDARRSGCSSGTHDRNSWRAGELELTYCQIPSQNLVCVKKRY